MNPYLLADMAESPSFYNYSYEEIKALRAKKAITNFRHAAGMHQAEAMRDQAEAQLRWSELYAGRAPFGSTKDLAASQALKETIAAQPGLDAARAQLEFSTNPMGMSYGSPAQRIR